MRNVQWLGLALVVAIGLCAIPPASAHAAAMAPPMLMQATDSLPPVPGEITEYVGKGWFLLIGAISSAIFGVLKLASTKVDSLSAPIKAIAFFGLTFVATFLTAKLGVPIPPDILHAGFGTVAAAIAAVAGMGIRALLNALGLSAALKTATAG